MNRAFFMLVGTANCLPREGTVLNSWIAIGDSFTEGVGDEGPDGVCIGWADRAAMMLAEVNPTFSYANLALRGKMVKEILDQQVPIAIEARPDLITICAGGNDIIMPGSDPDAVAARLETGIAALVATGAEVVVFTAPDPKMQPVVRRVRAKAAIYNSDIHAIADRHGVKIVDLWSMDPLRDRQAWSDDRLHFSSDGHRRISLRFAEVLGLTVSDDWREPYPDMPPMRWLELRRNDISWTRTHLIPWVRRQLRGESMGDGLSPKRPELRPYRDATYSESDDHSVTA
jgi:lysophospholipase L1-like esterase